jgi:filamentous hemagglutinin family protein
MTSYRGPARGHRSQRSLERLLLGSVSLLAIMASGVVADAANLNSIWSVSPAASAIAAQQAASAQAAAAGQQAQASLARAADALRAALAAQAAASAIARQAPTAVPDGLSVGGLNPAAGSGYAVGNPTVTDPTLWQNASAPVQSNQNGRTVVDIQQTQQKAILNWQTFNVGRNTTVDFNQGASNWTVLNRVADPAALPSQILGQIKATGGVYVINPNGIIFGGSAQVNVGTLIASDLDVGLLGTTRAARDQFFLNTGIGDALGTSQSFSTTFAQLGAPEPNSTVFFQGGPIGGGVQVDAGATIQTNVNPSAPGFVYLFGANVANYGTIIAPANEVALVTGQAITLTPGTYNAATIPSTVLTSAGFRGTGFEILQYAIEYLSVGGVVTPKTSFRPGTGAITHEGVIATTQGAVVMMGDQITIDNLHTAAGNLVLDPSTGNPVQGVIYAPTTGISRNSMVLLDAATSVTMNGIISIPPYEDGETLPLLSGAATSGTGSTVQSFTPAFVEMSGQVGVTLGSGALVSAPSASVALNAIASNPAFGGSSNQITPSVLGGSQAILLAGPGTVAGVAVAGATIDVAGLQDVQLPATYNFISFQPRGIDFADQPLQRSGPLYGQTLWVDIRATGKNSNGTTWCGTQVANGCTYVDTVKQSIDQLMTAGGTVSLKTDLTSSSATAVTLRNGSLINLAGGYEQFLPGTVPITVLLGIDGRRYSMENASPNMTYVGIAGQFTDTHAHWGITETWSSMTETSEAGYLQGSAAGGVSISTVTPELQGTMLFGSLVGERQIVAGTAPWQGALSITTPSSVVIGQSGDVSSNFTSTSQFATTLSDTQLSAYGLSSLSITANDVLLGAGSTLSLAAGGSFSVLVPGAIDIAGTVSAAGGQISLVTDRAAFSNSKIFDHWLSLPQTALGKADIFVEGTLDVSGRWVNDTGQFGTSRLGPGFINGGSITIATNNSSSPATNTTGTIDTTGSILLAPGSVLDVSSGGYISPNGTPKTVSTGVMAGSAGSITLALYQGGIFTGSSGNGSTSQPFTPTIGPVAVLQLDGTLRAYGFASNGTLTLGAPQTIQIGGQPGANGQPAGGGLYLPASLLTGGGFGAYVIESTPDGYSGVTANITVPGTSPLTLQQQNFSSIADYSAVPTGTKIAAVAPLATLPDDRRTPVNLTLASGNSQLGAGASIVTDAGASVAFFGAPGTAVANGIDTRTSTTASSVLLLGQIIDHGGAVSVYSMQTWLGPDATIDLSGTAIFNSRFGAGGVFTGVSATLLPGGSFTVEALPLQTPSTSSSSLAGSYLVAQQGATVDVSGISATILAKDATQRGVSPVDMRSDAGTVTADVGAFLWGGTFAAAGGRSPDTGAVANGGTLILGGSNVTLQQTSSNVTTELASLSTPANAANLVSLAAPFSNQIYAAVDRLTPFSDIFLYSVSAVTPGGAGHIFTDLTDKTFGAPAATFSPLTVTGPLDWSVANRLQIAASSIALDTNTPGSSAVLSAPYVLLTGGGGTTTSSIGSRASRLTVDAMNIDVEGAAFSNFAQVVLGGTPGPNNPNVYTTADIRLSTPKVSNGLPQTLTSAGGNPSTFAGSLVSDGDLTFWAKRIYPMSAVNFTIGAGQVTTTKSGGFGQPSTTTTSYSGTVTFNGPAGSAPQTPLSAGGSLTVLATTIVQDGNLFAPLGSITLGGTNPDGTGTQQVTLGAGSLTSVSLGNTVVPYGQTADGINWYYNDALAPLSQLPGKAVTLSGNNVTVALGSTINLSGGGDLQAIEFVAGQGGSHDVLATTSGRPVVYALLPSRNDAIAAFDINFTAAQSATQGGDPYPLAGTQIYINGGNGIPAGTYTLYPGHYATLPGALRVVDVGSNLGVNVPSGFVQPDGTVLVSGNYTQSTLPGTRSSGSELFAIQTGAVWQQYSQYTFTSANSYFAAKASKAGTNPPPLPIDAGRLAVVAQQQIILAGTALTQPGTDTSGNLGRGGQLDISGNQLAVVNGLAATPSGYIGLDVNELNALNFESVLIGGQRSDQANGTTTITPTASSVVVDTGGVAFAAPEILLVAAATPSQQTQTIKQSLSIGGGVFTTNFQVGTTVVGTGSVTIRSGSVVDTIGGVQSSYGRNYLYASSEVTAQTIATELGGTLDSSGTVINGANVFSLFTTGGAPISTLLPLYGGGLGALFVATNDPNVTIAGPTGTPALTINFANINPTLPVIGAVTLPAGNTGSVTIEAGARVSTNTFSVQATAQSNAIVLNKPVGGAPAAVIQARQVNLTAANIGVGASASGALVLSADNLAQIATVQGLSLKAFNGNITFYDGVSFGSTLQRLTLNAQALLGTGTGGVDINAAGATVTLVNSGAAGAVAIPAGTGTFSIEAAEIDLGGGIQTIAGFSEVDWTASNRIFLTGSGALTLGGSGATPVNLVMTTPNVLVGGATSSGAASQFTLTTLGNVTIARPASASADPGTSSEIGGNFALRATSIDDSGRIQAQAGTLALEATTGNLTLESGARIAAGGFAKTLIDVTEYVSGGTVSLRADNGNVVTVPTSVIDVSQPTGGQGYGGVINVTAAVGSANLQGQILASGYAGDATKGDPSRGGSFNLTAGGALALDPLADLLSSGGVTGAINIHTLLGNLVLSAGHKLQANAITLTADDTTTQNGQVIIAGLIEAGCTATFCNGKAGGQVGLYGANAVVLEGTAQIVASTTHADQLGGNVKLGIGWNAQGYIDLQTGSTIDVSGGSAGGGLSNGTVYLRAPLITGNAFQEGTVRVLGLNSAITGARTFTVEDYLTVSTEADIGPLNLSWNGIIDPLNNPSFTNAIAKFVEGTLTGNGVSYGFNGAVAQLTTPAVAAMLQNSPGAAVQLLPGVELVNVSTAVNGGNITVASNWNLAAGTAINVNAAAGTSVQLAAGGTFNPSANAVNFEYRYVANFGTQAQPSFQIEPGVLTLVAAANVNINASISDGFYAFGNYLDTTYVNKVNSYLNSTKASGALRGIDGTANSQSPNYLYLLNNYANVQIAPYDPTANTASPTSPQLTAADLFPHQLNVCTNCNGLDPSHPPTSLTSQVTQVTNPGSWSYQFTAGATAWFANGRVNVSANLATMMPLAILEAGPFVAANNGASVGNVNLSGHTTYLQPLYPSGSATVALPTMVRTGTGDITISAAQDITLSDPTAPGVIYAAGVNTVNYAANATDPGYHLDSKSGNVVATNTAGFLIPQVLAYGFSADITEVSAGFAAVFGPPTMAAFPDRGGNVTLVAQRDIVRNGNPTSITTNSNNNSVSVSSYQYYSPWLLADVGITPVADGNSVLASLFGAGVFAPIGNQIASQSAWWIQYGSFQQGILSAGGNVSVTAGRDLIDVSVSLPTTGYASGGLASVSSGALSTPVTTINGSGNMVVRAGRNILGGSFYEGSGTATIVAGGSVGANGVLTYTTKSGFNTVTNTLPDLPVLAVDTGQITLTAGGSESIGGVVNPAELHGQAGSWASPASVTSNSETVLFMDTYGPESAVDLVAIAGNLNIASSPTSAIYRAFNNQATTDYPASFSAVSLNGNITTIGLGSPPTSNGRGVTGSPNPGIVLSGSPDGSFQLLAEGSIDLTGGIAGLTNGAPTIPAAFPTFSAGPSLLDAAFDPYQPNNGSTGAFSQAVQAQNTDPVTARIYAVTGSITGAGQININRPTVVQAGLDIVDLNLNVQNIAATDVSTVTAGRDIYYTGLHNLGGMQVSGPGFFVVQAGRDLGPFLPAAFDTAASATSQEGITSVGNAGSIPVGNEWVNGSPGLYNPALLGPYANAVKNRNPLLSTTGADIITLFGVSKGIDYQAVIDTYIDPANAANVAHNYIGELTAFLCTTGALGCSQGVPPTGTDVFAKFESEPAALQHVFAYEVFAAELKNVANTSSSLYQYFQGNYDQYQKAALLDAYIMVNTLFPAAYGYTNNLGGSLQQIGSQVVNSAGQPVERVPVLGLIKSVDLSGSAGSLSQAAPQIHTGDLNLLHATIQTDLGGNVSLLGPGGNVQVGSLALEPNANLKLNNLGILTLDGGGINTFTDGNVLVDTSRIFTEQGGDVSMWSSNGNLDAGQGAKTTLSQPPLKVAFDQDDYQIIDPTGLVTGAGIGVLQTSTTAAAANLYLQAPRGIINFGSAGVRSSGNLVVVAPVISNSSNAGVAGTTTGVPVVAVPNIGALAAGTNTAGASTKSAETPTASGSRDQASVFIVEVIGYGGGDGQNNNQDNNQNNDQNNDQKKNQKNNN